MQGTELEDAVQRGLSAVSLHGVARLPVGKFSGGFMRRRISVEAVPNNSLQCSPLDIRARRLRGPVTPVFLTWFQRSHEPLEHPKLPARLGVRSDVVLPLSGPGSGLVGTTCGMLSRPAGAGRGIVLTTHSM